MNTIIANTTWCRDDQTHLVVGIQMPTRLILEILRILDDFSLGNVSEDVLLVSDVECGYVQWYHRLSRTMFPLGDNIHCRMARDGYCVVPEDMSRVGIERHSATILIKKDGSGFEVTLLDDEDGDPISRSTTIPPKALEKVGNVKAKDIRRLLDAVKREDQNNAS